MKIIITTTEETVSYSYNPQKRTNQISTRGVLENKGVCRVQYRKSEYNEFEFDGVEDFKRRFAPCVEKDLLKFLGVRGV